MYFCFLRVKGEKKMRERERIFRAWNSFVSRFLFMSSSLLRENWLHTQRARVSELLALSVLCAHNLRLWRAHTSSPTRTLNISSSSSSELWVWTLAAALLSSLFSRSIISIQSACLLSMHQQQQQKRQQCTLLTGTQLVAAAAAAALLLLLAECLSKSVG